METWKAVYKDLPQGYYFATLKNSYETGCVVELESNTHRISVDFGIQATVRMLDERILMSDVLYEEDAFEPLKKEQFKDLIYKVENGQLKKLVEVVSCGIYGEWQHYGIVTPDNVIEVVTQCEPEVTVEELA